MLHKPLKPVLCTFTGWEQVITVILGYALDKQAFFWHHLIIGLMCSQTTFTCIDPCFWFYATFLEYASFMPQILKDFSCFWGICCINDHKTTFKGSSPILPLLKHNLLDSSHHSCSAIQYQQADTYYGSSFHSWAGLE
jgi:hypothetical protein